MKSSPILDLGSEPSPKLNPSTAQPADDRTQMSKLIEDTRSDVRRMRSQLEHQENAHDAHERRAKIAFLLVGLLLVVFAVACWLAYPAVRGQKQSVAGILGLQNVSYTLGERIQSVEGKLNTTISGLPALTSRMDQLTATMKSNMQTMRNQAQTAATQMGQRLRADLNQSIQAIQSRVASLESNQKESSGHVSELEEQITGLKQQLAAMREESSAAADKIKQLQDEQQTRTTALSSMDQKLTSHQTALDSISNRIDSKRVGFDVQGHKTEQISPEVYLTINRMDSKKQEIDGRLQLTRDSRIVPIRALGVRSPLVFYTTTDTRPLTLVLTQVDKDRVAGYVMMPPPPMTATNASNTQ